MNSTQLTGQLIRLDQISFPPDYERKASLVEDDALRQSIEKSGVQQSIVVLETDGRYTLVKGGRRLLIAQAKGDNLIHAVIAQLPEGENADLFRNKLRFVLTQARQDLRPSQRASFINQLMERFGMKQKDVASYLGVNEGSISNWLAIDNYVPTIVRAIDTGELTPHAARAFDNLSPEGQERVWKNERKILTNIAGDKAHKLVRTKYSPKSHPSFYVDPEKTLSKMAVTQRGRKSKRRPRLTRNEKDLLARDVTLKEVELADGTEELKALKRGIMLATAPLHAIHRNASLWQLVPYEVRPEIERFLEVY